VGIQLIPTRLLFFVRRLGKQWQKSTARSSVQFSTRQRPWFGSTSRTRFFVDSDIPTLRRRRDDGVVLGALDSSDVLGSDASWRYSEPLSDGDMVSGVVRAEQQESETFPH